MTTDKHGRGNRQQLDLSATVPWENTSGETVPAFGVVQLRSNFSTTSKASKPNAGTGLFFANGPVTVAASEFGESLVWNKPRKVLVNGSVTVGDEVGPVSGQWYMSAEGTGWRVLHQPVSDVAVVVKDGGSAAQFAFGVLGQDSGRDDSLLPVTIYDTADLDMFTSSQCGSGGSGSGSGGDGSGGSGSGEDNSFLDMELSLCTEIGTEMVLVPAGYKAGNVGLAKWPVCNAGGSGSGSSSGSGSGSGLDSWTGWVVVFGKRLRCVLKIPYYECCPTTGLQITKYKRVWYFGEPLDDELLPCDAGSGSGSGSGDGSGSGSGGLGTGELPP